MSAAQDEPKFCIMTGTAGNTSLIFQHNKIHFHATQDVKVEGAQKQPLEPLEQPKKQEEEGITPSDIVHAGLAVLGCVPGLGTVASLIDAGLYAVEGNGEMAAISLLAAVPGAGEAAAIAKLATKAGKIGKMAKVASNVAKGAKVAKALKYTSNVARLLVAAAVIKGLYDNRMIIKQLLAMMQKGQFDWKNPKFLLGVVTLLAQIAVMKKFKLNEGSGKVAGEVGQATGQYEKIAGSNINHVNGAIGEAQGYNQALSKGEIGIQAPGKVTATGPDYITYDPKTQTINVWDSKYSSTGKWPNSAKGFGSKAWINETKQAIDNIADPALRQQVQEAFKNGNINWQIFKWPQ